ncbi:glutamine--scyllo-inositol aminotransferase [Halothiobacillus diazotrophicus]|uniref:Glutamine--scyllo-inositol aminotransferase n=1 Tax=Halothiobacillus diazotrophicus TaxID=1860122 RepID=A0A191ZIL7_9GAMM|nr:DegT/DnrJ/EryC1/StrS family aminotransferase [Halothiobacillus diazotrophicus]ANJ67714.1 glutamine--scyllo-inositol aminotransferase [Halothiobacillus diazotrophicus]
MKQKIFYTKPSITEREVSLATDAAQNGWGAQCYDYIHRFEEAFKLHLGVKHAIATSSCTGALHMGLAAIGVKPGDEVILADTNWIASAAPITYLGAKPVFVDILPDTWCLDPEKVEAAITSKTKAILAVHLYGNLSAMNELNTIGNKYGIPILEDAAEAIGSIYQGHKAGSMGLFGTFSFHGTKTITTGEGGMIVTNDDALYDQLCTLSNHGRNKNQTKQFWPDTIGFKYKMSNVQAAIGCAQMERIDDLIARKREIFAYYKARLANIPGIKMNPEPKGSTIGAWMPTIQFYNSPESVVERLKQNFNQEQIDARVFFHPLSSLPMFDNHGCTPIAYRTAKQAINLPSYHDITKNELDRVCSVITGTLSEMG